MKSNIFYTFIFSILLLSIFSKVSLKFLSNDEEKDIRKKTMNSITRVSESLNFYMVNYQNDYYLDEILNIGVKSLEEMLRLAKNLYGNDYDFDVEIQSKPFACSSFNCNNKNNENLFARNFDYNSNSVFVFWTNPKNGYKSINFASGLFLGYNSEQTDKNFIRDRLLLLPYLTMDGMNENGLSVSILYLEEKPTHQVDPAKKDLYNILFFRGILDKCKNVDEAISFFKSYNMHEPFGYKNTDYHYLISDGEGKSVVIEYINNEMKLNYPNSELPFSFVTNFIITPGVTPSSEYGKDRYLIIQNKLKEKQGILEWNEVMEVLKSVGLSKKDPTQWSNVYNTKTKKIITSIQTNYNEMYELNIFEPLKFTKKDKSSSSSSISSRLSGGAIAAIVFAVLLLLQ